MHINKGTREMQARHVTGGRKSENTVCTALFKKYVYMGLFFLKKTLYNSEHTLSDFVLNSKYNHVEDVKQMSEII